MDIKFLNNGEKLQIVVSGMKLGEAVVCWEFNKVSVNKPINHRTMSFSYEAQVIQTLVESISKYKIKIGYLDSFDIRGLRWSCSNAQRAKLLDFFNYCINDLCSDNEAIIYRRDNGSIYRVCKNLKNSSILIYDTEEYITIIIRNDSDKREI